MAKKEVEKLEIDDIKDPLDELDAKADDTGLKTADVDLEEAVAEDTETLEEKPELNKEAVSSITKKEDKPDSNKAEKDELEKAVDEPLLEEKVAEPKPVKLKKPFPWRGLVIAVITFLVTAALALGGFYLYQTKFAPKSSDTDKTNQSAASTSGTETPKTAQTQKTVYVTSETGLNLRQSASSSSAKLALIPFGTQLVVQATQGTWYQVTYSGQTGWIDSTYTGTENPTVYKNTDYGFQFTVPSDWGGYKLFSIKADSSETAAWYVAIPTTTASYSESGIDKGYASMMAISVFTPDQWKTISAAEGPKPTLAIQNSQWVIAYSLPNGTPPTDLASQAAETKQVTASIKFY